MNSILAIIGFFNNYLMNIYRVYLVTKIKYITNKENTRGDVLEPFREFNLTNYKLSRFITFKNTDIVQTIELVKMLRQGTIQPRNRFNNMEESLTINEWLGTYFDKDDEPLEKLYKLDGEVFLYQLRVRNLIKDYDDKDVVGIKLISDLKQEIFPIVELLDFLKATDEQIVRKK